MADNKSSKIKKGITCRILAYRSNRYVCCQAIDKENGTTIVSISSKTIDQKLAPTKKAEIVGEKVAAVIKNGYKKFIFDRNGYIYHGQVKSLAEGLRKSGIKI